MSIERLQEGAFGLEGAAKPQPSSKAPPGFHYPTALDVLRLAVEAHLDVATSMDHDVADWCESVGPLTEALDEVRRGLGMGPHRDEEELRSAAKPRSYVSPEAPLASWIDEMVDTWADGEEQSALLRADIGTLLSIAGAHAKCRQGGGEVRWVVKIGSLYWDLDYYGDTWVDDQRQACKFAHRSLACELARRTGGRVVRLVAKVTK